MADFPRRIIMHFLRLILLVVLLSLTLSSAHAVTAEEAYAAMTAGDYTSAAKMWQQLINRENEYPVALNNLGYCQMMTGQYALAADSYLRSDAISASLDAKSGMQWAYLALERYGDSIPWGEAALKLDPGNYWVRTRLAYAYKTLENDESAERNYREVMEIHGARSLTLAPRAQLIPYYNGIRYSGSTLKTTGYEAGLFALWNFDAGITAGGGLAQNTVANPKSADAYSTQEIRLMTGFLFADLSSFTLNGHLLNANTSYIDRGVTLSGTYRSGLDSGFAITGDVLVFSQHGGGALTPMYFFPISRSWQLGVGAQVQAIGFARSLEIYGAAQAALRYCSGLFCMSTGGLYGSLFMPVLDGGNILAYNPDELAFLAFAKLSIRPADFVEISASYSYAKWKALNGESPFSGIWTIAATGSIR